MDLGITQYVSLQTFDRYSESALIRTVSGNGNGDNSIVSQFITKLIHDPGRRHDRAFSDFALLYAATIEGAAGSRDSLAQYIRGVNGNDQEKVLDALFGDGTQRGSIVNGVLIGGKATANQETYPDIHYALGQLGFREGGSSPTWNTLPSLKTMGWHQNHFHFYLQPPKVRLLTPAGKALTTAEEIVTKVSDASSSQILRKISPEIVRKVEQATLKLCAESENQSSKERLGIPGGVMGPAYSVLGLLKDFYHIDPSGLIETSVTKRPTFGKVDSGAQYQSQSFPNVGKISNFIYTPNPNFYGTDRVDFQVKVNGHTFRVTYVVNVLESWNNGESCKPDDAVEEYEGTLNPMPTNVSIVQYALEGVDEIISEESMEQDQWLENNQLASLGLGLGYADFIFDSIQGISVREALNKC